MTKKLRTKRLKSCWVYVLECGDGSYYTGWTNDLAKRVRSHQSGKGGKYTRSRLPVKLIKKWKAKNRSEAMGKEAFFKSLSRKEKEIKLRQFGLGKQVECGPQPLHARAGRSLCGRKKS